MKGKRWLVIDCETTGLLLPAEAPLADQPSIIELAVTEIKNNKRCASVSWLIKPPAPISEEITKITGITNEDLEDAPNFASVLKNISETFLGAHGMIAHNLPFDRGMLINELRRLGKEFSFPWPPEQICTVAAFNHLKGRRVKLTELYQLITEKELKQTHRAQADVDALVEIVIKSELIK